MDPNQKDYAPRPGGVFYNHSMHPNDAASMGMGGGGGRGHDSLTASKSVSISDPDPLPYGSTATTAAPLLPRPKWRPPLDLVRASSQAIQRRA